MLAMESASCIETIKAELERAYARLRSLPLGNASDPIVAEIERLERELLERYASYVAKRDSAPPDKA